LSTREIKIHARIENGGLLSLANLPRIRAFDTKDTKGHVGAPKGYRSEWRLIHDPKRGFAWVETVYGTGICGWAPTLRAAVLNVALGICGSHIRIAVDDEPRPVARPIPNFRFHCLAAWAHVPEWTHPEADFGAPSWGHHKGHSHLLPILAKLEAAAAGRSARTNDGFYDDCEGGHAAP
jgi:hypothetical protein